MIATRKCSALSLLLVASCMLALAPACLGHGFLTAPLSRARVAGYADWEAAGGNGLGTRPFRTNPDGSLLNDQSDVCGDPHQDVGYMNLVNRASTIQATYSAGSVISVTWRMTVNHGGWIAISICPSTRNGATQGCFDSYQLVNADTGYRRWWIQTGQYGVESTYVTRWRLPAGVTCDGGCVMQATYRTANSCVDSCASAECGPSYAARNNPVTGQTGLSTCGRTEIFRDCADIRITGTTTAPTTSAPTPVSTGGVCDKCNVPVCRGGCKCDGNCACRAGLGGSKCDKCNVAQSDGGCKCDNNCDCISGTCWF